MARKMLIIAVFAGLSYSAVSFSTDIRRYLDGQFYSLAMLSKSRL